MAQTVITLSVKIQWWVKPLIFCAMVWRKLRLPIDVNLFAKFCGRGVIPVVK